MTQSRELLSQLSSALAAEQQNLQTPKQIPDEYTFADSVLAAADPRTILACDLECLSEHGAAGMGPGILQQKNIVSGLVCSGLHVQLLHE